MANRRAAREFAVQFLFQNDFNPGDPDEALTLFWNDKTCPAEARKFAETLLRGTLEKRVEIDELIIKCAEHWDINRMSAVDRNVLRLAIYEMLFRNDIPPVVSINEAIDIAAKFGGVDSSKFVNGILDKAMRGISRPHRTEAP